MRHHTLLLLVLFLLGAAMVPAVLLATPADSGPGGAGSAMIFDIEESLTCQCGCGLTVHACNHLNCPSGIPMKKEIGELIAQGQTKQQILDHFRGRYGEKVLSSPTLSGFNLMAWIMPFVVLAVGGVVVTRVARRWVRQTAAPALPSRPAAAPPADAAYRERLAREIAEFDR